MNKLRTLCAWLFLFNLCFSGVIYAESVIDQLRIIEKAVNMAVSRIETGFVADPEPGDFKGLCGRQFELAVLSLSAEHLLEEDYYHLALYMMTTHFRLYDDAIEILELELDLARHRPVKKWLKTRIARLREVKKSGKPAPAKQFSITEEFKSLRQTLTR